MRPELRRVWDDDIAGVRQLWGDRIARGDWGKDHIAIAVSLAIDDHLVACETQLAEARRLLAQYVTPFDPQRGATDCLSCGGYVSTGMFEDVWAAHTEDCPVGAFLAATAGVE